MVSQEGFWFTSWILPFQTQQSVHVCQNFPKTFVQTTCLEENEFFARHQRFSLEHSPLQFGFCRHHPSERHESVCLQCKTRLCRMCTLAKVDWNGNWQKNPIVLYWSQEDVSHYINDSWSKGMILGIGPGMYQKWRFKQMNGTICCCTCCWTRVHSTAI